MLSRLAARVSARAATAHTAVRATSVARAAAAAASVPRRGMSGGHGHGDAHGHGGGIPTPRVRSAEDAFPMAPPLQAREPSARIGASPVRDDKWFSILNQYQRPPRYHYTDARNEDWLRDLRARGALPPPTEPKPTAREAFKPVRLQLLGLFALGAGVVGFLVMKEKKKRPAWAEGKKDAKDAKEAKGTGSKAASGLDSAAFGPLKLIEIKAYNHNTKQYVFELATPDAKLNLPTASFVLVKSDKKTDDGKDVIRPYTPIDQHVPGQLHLLVKHYPNGALTSWLATVKVGDVVQFKGPVRKIEYKPNMKKALGFIAGGSGLTPMLQVIDEVLSNPSDTTQLSLLFANDTPQDILLKERLDELAARFPKQFKVNYVVLKPTKDWTGETGYVTEDLIKKHMPAPSKDSLVMVCGPPPMMKALSGDKVKNPSTGAMEQGKVEGVLAKMQYNSDTVFKF